jgi:uncharacterized protein YfaT (DUF1175 family)
VRRALRFRPLLPFALILPFLALGVYTEWGRSGSASAAKPPAEISAGERSYAPEALADGSLEGEIRADAAGDGFPDGARLDDPRDRQNFTRWLTYLAETLYYHPSPQAREEVQDCAALIRYAYRNALLAHTAAWRRSAGLLDDPGVADIRKFTYPEWPLGRGLFRTRPGPFLQADLGRGAFAEFADVATLLHFNTFPVSRDIRAAQPGDLLFFYQPAQHEPYHSMLFVGASHYQPQGADWIVYHTGDLNGQPGEVRLLPARLLMQHPDPRWRPLAANPQFLGVYRFALLR